MITVPHPEPTTRAEARANAIACMFDREHLHMTGHRDEHLRTAEVWSRIALTFPENSEYEVLTADDRLVQDDTVYSDRPEHLGDYMGSRKQNTQEPCGTCDGRGCAECFHTGSEEVADGRQDPDATAVLVLPQREAVKTVLADSGSGDPTDRTIPVSAVAWDVLRLLAIRYVLSSINRGITVDLTDEDTGPRVWDLEFIHVPGSPIVQVTVSRADDTVTG